MWRNVHSNQKKHNLDHTKFHRAPCETSWIFCADQKKIDTKPGTNSGFWLLCLGVPITCLCWAPLAPWRAVMSQNSVGREPMAPLQNSAPAKGACSLGWAPGREGKVLYKYLLSLWSFCAVFYLFSQYTNQ